MKKRIIVLGVSLIAIVGIIIGVSYAFFSTGGSQETANTFQSGCLNISLTDASASISLSNIYPITDIEGLDGTSYDFTIENTCNTDANYQINLESLNEVANSLSANYIKVSLSSDTVGNVISVLSDNTSVTPEIEGSYEAYNLYTGTLGASETKTYHLKLWLDYDATVEQAANKVYQSKINVIANPEIQVVDNLEATFELNDRTLTSNLTSNVTSATYCTTTDNICTPSTSATISNSKYNIDLSNATPTKQVATVLGNITVNVSSPQMVCTQLNGISKLICSNPEEAGTPNFANASCTSGCGEATLGIYETTDDLGAAYYYRGDVGNNYVQFAGFYWRIIRINGDGSVRIIYDGTSAHANGESSEDRHVITSAYNEDWSQGSYYVGYTYVEGYQRPAEQNWGIASTIKVVLDNWYSINITNQGYDSKVVSTPGFCNDRNTASGYNWGPTDDFYYAPYERVYTTRQPTLQCSNNLDLYTTKVGLITVDEVMYAGGNDPENNNSYYLYSGEYYWTMSPIESATGDSFGLIVTDDGGIGESWVDAPYGVRPVINLSADVTISDGNGTMDNPYVVAT